jgi:hypothetical protein
MYFTRAHNDHLNDYETSYRQNMKSFFATEASYQVPQIALNIALVKIMMTYNTPMPNKIDLVLNREISLLVLLKNKVAQPDLFGVHEDGTLENLEPMHVSTRGLPHNSVSLSKEPENLSF